MYNYTNVTLPKITDLFNNTGTTQNLMQVFTYFWSYIFGAYFVGAVVAVLGVALYIKYENATVAIVWFIICGFLFGAALQSFVLFLFFVIGSVTIGLVLYKLFVTKE